MSPSGFDVAGEFLFLGRTFREYRRMFDLDPEGHARRPILDCPGGPSSFAPVAADLGAAVTAVDPAYGQSVDALATTCEQAIEETAAQLRESADAYVWDVYDDVDTRIRYLRAAANRFLADYATALDRYIRAGLPDLPFDADAFDLALSGNFLFLYDDRLDRAFHERAIRELSRVAREVRIFPVASLDRTRSDYVVPVVEKLREEGYHVEFRGVPYEFQPGATEMLAVE